MCLFFLCLLRLQFHPPPPQRQVDHFKANFIVKIISSLALLGIYFLTSCKLKVKILAFGLGLTYFRVLGFHMSLSCFW